MKTYCNINTLFEEALAKPFLTISILSLIGILIILFVTIRRRKRLSDWFSDKY